MCVCVIMFLGCDCFGVAPVVICSLGLLSVLCLDCQILWEDVWESPCRVDSICSVVGYRCECDHVTSDSPLRGVMGHVRGVMGHVGVGVKMGGT